MRVRIRARFTNENFRAARIAAGFARMIELHEATGIALNTLYSFENFRGYPRTPKMTRRIERAIGLPAEDLFPGVYKDAVDRKLGRPLERVLSLRELPEWAGPKMLPMPEEVLEATEMREAVDRALEQLTDREAEVVRLRFGIPDGNEHDLGEIGVKFKVSRERIRQIEAKALRKLLHPRNSRSLREHLPPTPQVEAKTRMRKIWPGYGVYVYDPEIPVCLKCRKMLFQCDAVAIHDLECHNEYLTTPNEVLKWPSDFLYCGKCRRVYRRKRSWKKEEEIGKA